MFFYMDQYQMIQIDLNLNSYGLASRLTVICVSGLAFISSITVLKNPLKLEQAIIHYLKHYL